MLYLKIDALSFFYIFYIVHIILDSPQFFFLPKYRMCIISEKFFDSKITPKFLISLKIAGLSYRLFITSFTFSRHFTNFMANLKINRGGKSPTEICEIKSAIASDIYVYTSKHILTLIFHPIKFLLKKPLWKNHNL